jgi:hypothetical protein
MMFPPFLIYVLKQQSRGDFARPPPTGDQAFTSTDFSRLLLWNAMDGTRS